MKLKTTTTSKENLKAYLNEIQACNECYSQEEVENIDLRISQGEWKDLKQFAWFIWNHQEVCLTCTSDLFEVA